LAHAHVHWISRRRGINAGRSVRQREIGMGFAIPISDGEIGQDRAIVIALPRLSRGGLGEAVGRSKGLLLPEG
jgi:hypothetical protein